LAGMDLKNFPMAEGIEHIEYQSLVQKRENLGIARYSKAEIFLIFTSLLANEVGFVKFRLHL